MIEDCFLTKSCLTVSLAFLLQLWASCLFVTTLRRPHPSQSQPLPRVLPLCPHLLSPSLKSLSWATPPLSAPATTLVQLMVDTCAIWCFVNNNAYLSRDAFSYKSAFLLSQITEFLRRSEKMLVLQKIIWKSMGGNKHPDTLHVLCSCGPTVISYIVIMENNFQWLSQE